VHVQIQQLEVPMASILILLLALLRQRVQVAPLLEGLVIMVELKLVQLPEVVVPQRPKQRLELAVLARLG
jgi:hypothetical protein